MTQPGLDNLTGGDQDEDRIDDAGSVLGTSSADGGWLRLPDAGAARVSLQKLTNDRTETSTFPRGTGDDSSVDVARHADGDPGGVRGRGRVERRPAWAGLPGRNVQVTLNARRQSLEVGF